MAVGDLAFYYTLYLWVEVAVSSSVDKEGRCPRNIRSKGNGQKPAVIARGVPQLI